MLLMMAGGVLAALGLLAAVLLVAAPLGLLPATAGVSLWLLFPLFSLLGYGLLVVGSKDPAAKAPTLALAVPLLLVALLAAAGLMAHGAGLRPVAEGASTAALWYVLALGGLMGALGSATAGRARHGGG